MHYEQHLPPRDIAAKRKQSVSNVNQNNRDAIRSDTVLQVTGARLLTRTGHILCLGLILSWTWCLVAAHGAESRIGIRLLWTTDSKTFTESGATVTDIDGDGLAEVLVAGREEIIALEGDGREAWRWRTKGRFMTYPAVLERPKTTALIFAADNGGLFSCLDGAGKPVWQRQLSAPSSWSASVVADLNADGTWEVIQTDETGTVWAFDAATGKPEWQTAVKGAPVSPAAGDLNEDGKAEVVVVTGKGIVTVLAADGTVLWEYQMGGYSDTWATSAPVIFGASSGLGRVVAASNEGRIVCLDSAGRLVWQRTVRGPVASGISVGDMDLDGETDVFVVTQLGVIYRFKEDGTQLWEMDMQGRSLAAGAMIDLDGDGSLEYVLCTQQGRLLVLDRLGRFIFDTQFDNRTINVTPAFGEIDRKVPGLEMVITGGESGRVSCFSTRARAGGLAHWIAYRGNEQKTGVWFPPVRKSSVEMTPENLSSEGLFTRSTVRFAISRGDVQGTLDATATCITPHGTMLVATSKVTGKHGVMILPVNVLWAGTYRFAWSVRDPHGNELLSRSREIHLEPFKNDRNLANGSIAALRRSADVVGAVLPRSGEALRREARLLAQELNDVIPLQDSSSVNGTSPEDRILDISAALVEHAHRAEELAEIVEKAASLGSATSLVLFEGSLWENREVNRQLPEDVKRSLNITRSMVPEEHEPVGLGILNILDRPVRARVSIDVPEGGPVVIQHRSVEVITALGESSWDPLPELDESQMLTIPPLSNEELWLDVHAAGVKPGEYPVKVRVQALNGAEVVESSRSPQSVPPAESVVTIQVRVLPFEMVPAGEFRLCAWATLTRSAIEDLLSHGNNVFVCPHGKPEYDAQGSLIRVDFSDLDAVVALLQGNDVALLLNGIPVLGVGFGNPEYPRRLTAYLNELVKHLAGKGFDTSHFALYPVDEPMGQGWNAVETVAGFGKMVKEANPAIMIYVNGGGELPMYEVLAPVTDIWCPGITMLPDNSSEMRIMRTSGKMLWSYDCAYPYARPVGPNIKNINIVGQFRTAALFAFRHGATGIGYWCYNIGENPWGRIQAEYPLVYPGSTRPVTSRRWEAVREGIEDYRILSALRRASQAPKTGRAEAEVQKRIRTLLEERLPAMIDESNANVVLGQARYVLDAVSNDSTIRAFRDEMMRCVEALARCETLD